jgi:hypothetical protein
VDDLIAEAERMPDAAVRFARGLAQVWTPEHLIPLRTRVREKHTAELHSLFAAIDERFGTSGATTDYVNAFYAAGEMAVMERVGRDELSDTDRQALRNLWETLLAQ